MKKIAMALAALVMAGSAFAADVIFYNKLYEDGAIWEDNGTDSEIKFPGLKDKMEVEYKSAHVDAGITTIMSVAKDYDDVTGNGATKDFYLDGYIDDWYLEWRMFQAVTICLHDNIYADASKLAVADDEMEGGNIGSDGFTVVYRPSMFNRALRLAATLPFDFTKNSDDPIVKANWLKGKDLNGTEYVNMGLGAIYTGSVFQVSAKVADVLDDDERIIGFTLSFPNITKGLTIGAGFTNTQSGAELCDEVPVTGENVFNVQLAYVNGAFRFDAETVISLDKEADFDKYFGAMIGYDATETLTLGAKFQYYVAGSDCSTNEDNSWALGVTADISIDEHNSIGFEFDYGVHGDFKKICVPVYWKWTL